MRQRASVEAAGNDVLNTLGGCDILVANAGVSTMQRAVDLTDEDWDFNFAVNARGVFLTNQIAARYFLAEKGGCIVNTASLAAKVGAPLLAHYSASKFAVLGWTSSARARTRPARHPSQRSLSWLCEDRHAVPRGSVGRRNCAD